MEQVILNLVLNSRDAMPQGGRLSIETANAESQAWPPGTGAGPCVVLTVSDNGCGMDAETRSRVFEPFFTTKGVDRGTGLGLSTVYGIVKQSEGFVWVYSEPGLGTTFKVYLPRGGAAHAPPRPADRSPVARGGTETILIVEDEDLVRALASRSLRERGYRVIEARQGVEALQQLEQQSAGVDLVISDVVMPEMGGRELARRLAMLRPSLPVLFISGYTGEDVIQRGLMEPGAPFQQKPFTPDGLARKVREMLDAVPRAPAATGG
jgi:CheY-like chemotaxis protein